MTPEQLARVGHDADEALQRGEHKRALSLYVQLEQHEPNNPRWPTAEALVLRKFGQRAQEVEALLRAAQIHADQSDTVRAVAVLKQILAIEPQHAGARSLLGGLHKRARPVKETRREAAPAAPLVVRAGAPLEELSLREVMPGAIPRSRTSTGSTPPVYRIPLADEADAAPLALDSTSGHFAPVPTSKRDDFSLEDAALDLVAKETMLAQRVHQVLPAVPLFAELPEASLDRLIEAAQLVDLEQGKEIFHQGDTGDALYVVAQGMVGVVDEGPPRKGVAKLGPGSVFGEIALLTDHPRTATVMALAPTQLVAIDRRALREALSQDPAALPVVLKFLRDRLVDRLVATHPLFTVLSSADRQRLRSRFRLLEVESGGALIREGTPAEGLLVLLSGSCEVVRGDRERLSMLEPGDIAGEMSLLTQSPAIATVRARTKTWAIELAGADFLRILSARPEAKAYIERVVEQRRAALGWR
jgi:CRP-like cAMP-binding protein